MTMEQVPKFEENPENEKNPIANESIIDKRYAEIEELLRVHPEGESWLWGLKDIGTIDDAEDEAKLNKILLQISGATNIPITELKQFQYFFNMEEGQKMETATSEELERMKIEYRIRK